MPLYFKTDPATDYSSALLPPVQSFQEVFGAEAEFYGAWAVDQNGQDGESISRWPSDFGGLTLSGEGSSFEFATRDGIKVARADGSGDVIRRLSLPQNAHAGATGFTLGLRGYWVNEGPNPSITFIERGNSGFRVDRGAPGTHRLCGQGFPAQNALGASGAILALNWHTVIYTISGTTSRIEANGLIVAEASAGDALMINAGSDIGFGSWSTSGVAKYDFTRAVLIGRDTYGDPAYDAVRGFLNM